MSENESQVTFLLHLQGGPSNLHRLLLVLAHTGAWQESGNPGGSSARPPGSLNPGDGTPAPGRWVLWPQKEDRGPPGHAGWLCPGMEGPAGGMGRG